jgi:hypothetical protein
MAVSMERLETLIIYEALCQRPELPVLKAMEKNQTGLPGCAVQFFHQLLSALATKHG